MHEDFGGPMPTGTNTSMRSSENLLTFTVFSNQAVVGKHGLMNYIAELQRVDGMWFLEHVHNGLFPYDLRAIADKLDELNRVTE